jgi:hypothetical protein
MTSLDQFRAEKDDFFASHPQSPLTTAQKKEFHGLNYFPENSALRLDVDVELIPGRDVIQVQTTTGDIREYIRYGRFTFNVDGQEVSLTIYEADYGFFLPFVDSLAGTETYPAGRYLEPEALSPTRFHVDFNLAYNPYCAYNEAWSCPLTPFENRLKAPIRAGEKLFHA